MQFIPYSTHYTQLDELEIVASAIKRVVYPDAENILIRVLKNKGVDSMVTVYKTLKVNILQNDYRKKFLKILPYAIKSRTNGKGY